MRGDHVERIARIRGPAHHRRAGRKLNRHRFARQRRLVQHRDPLDHRAIDRRHLARPHQKPVARNDRHGFLAEGSGDPRPEFMARPREAVAQEGSLVAYNAAFEKEVLQECAGALPALQPWVASLECS